MTLDEWTEQNGLLDLQGEINAHVRSMTEGSNLIHSDKDALTRLIMISIRQESENKGWTKSNVKFNYKAYNPHKEIYTPEVTTYFYADDDMNEVKVKVDAEGNILLEEQTGQCACASCIEGT